MQSQRQPPPVFQIATYFHTSLGLANPETGAGALRMKIALKIEVVLLITQIGIDVIFLIGVERLVEVRLQRDIAANLDKIAPLPAQGIDLRHRVGGADVE